MLNTPASTNPECKLTIFVSDSEETESEMICPPDDLPPFNHKKYPTPAIPTDPRMLIPALEQAIPKMEEFQKTLHLQRSLLMEKRLKRQEKLKPEQLQSDVKLQAQGLLIGCYDGISQ
jgi:hypothetical protein